MINNPPRHSNPGTAGVFSTHADYACFGILNVCWQYAIPAATCHSRFPGNPPVPATEKAV